MHIKIQINMSKMRNKVQLIGRLGAKADVKRLESGKIVANFNLATNEVYYNTKDEKVEETTWHHLVAWGKTAELIEKFTDKGSEIAVEGKLINRNYEDKEGVKRYVTEVQVSEVLLLGEKVAQIS
jgi:single-strand DNA-binding protein